jgi:glycogen debranching enzyme
MTTSRLPSSGTTRLPRVSQDLCQDYSRSSRLEWLETNGTGAFAMGTVSGANTRRYHGYLVAANSDAGRRVRLAKVDEELNGQPLGTNQFPSAVYPEGFRHLVEFSLDPNPRWTYQVGGVRLQKSLYLVPGRSVAVVEYAASAPCQLTARAFLAERDYHHLRVGYEVPTGCCLQAVNGELEYEAGWWRDFEYLVELDRGFPFREDLYTPGVYRFALEPGRPAGLVASLEPDLRIDLERWRNAREQRPHDPASDFDACRADGQPTLIAGYPWFTDWGRDTMISLPGLVTGRGQREKARSIIDAFLSHRRQGLIPNRFPDVGETPEYNAVDATLWLVAAIADLDAADLRPVVREIVDWFRRGTLYGIRVDPADGLLAAGDATTNLTWMDARYNGMPMTSRHGKAVEINALWINALAFLADPVLESTRRSFQRHFWNGRYLSDCVGDDALRPNQLLALSLPVACVTDEQARVVLEVIEAELLTPFGLRTLSPRDPRYQGRYEGSPAARDAAYHQGTVWPWLLGPYLTACLRYRPGTRVVVESQLRIWRDQTMVGCLGHIAEIYDGDAPHRPLGAPAQAWSLAELLRVEQLLSR